MSSFGRAWRYVSRQRVKSFIILGIFAAMMSALMVTGSVTRAADAAGAQVDRRTGAGFVLQNNPQFNQGTPRGAGTVKGADIEKIAKLKNVESYVARQNVTADLVGANVKKLDHNEYDEQKEKQFGNAANVWGVNGSELENSFRGGALTLTQGRHLRSGDSHKALIHEDLAKANGLKVGDEITVKGNQFDVDNQNKSTTEVKTEIVGLFSGDNPRPVAQRSELFANTLFTDLDTTRELYGWTAKTEIYQDANFFVKKGAELKAVAQEASRLGIDWRNYQLAPSTQYLAGITGAVDGVRSIMNGAKIATFVLAIALLSLMLFLWLGERKKETGVLLSVGTTKGGMLRQYWMELGLIAIPAIGISYLVSTFIAQSIGSSVLGSVNSSAKNGFTPGQQAGADLESSSALKTLDSLHVSLGNQDVAYVAIAAAVVIIVCVLLAALPMLRTAPKKLLVALK